MNHALFSARPFAAHALFLFLAGALCATPLVAVIAPRLLAFIPPFMALLGLGLYRLSGQSWPVIPKSLALWLSAITGLCLLSSFWAIGGTETIGRALRIGLVLGSILLLLPLISTTQEKAPLRETVMGFFPRAFFLATLLCLLDLYGNGPLYYLFHEKSDDELNLSRLNRSVIALVFMSFPALWCVWYGGLARTRKWLFLGLVLLAIGALFYKTESQSAQLALMVGIFFAALFPVRWKAPWYGLKTLILGGMLIAPWLAQYMFAALAASAKTMPWLSRGYAADRMEIWDMISGKALASPLYGFGLEATRDIPHFETQNLYNPLDHVLHPHNFVLQIWIEFGMIGIVLACGFFVFILNNMERQTHPTAKLCLAVFMAVFAASAMSYGLWQGWWLGLFVLLAALIRLLRTPS